MLNAKVKLILENGRSFEGEAFGHVKDSEGEVIFCSGSEGYQEMMTDPAFAGKLLVMTSPLVGNYGINLDDSESDMPSINGLIVRECCETPSNWRCEMDLDGFLKQHKIMGMRKIDTRELTRIIRDNGTMRGVITTRAEADIAAYGIDTPADAERGEKYVIENTGRHIAVLDLGAQRSMFKELKLRRVKMTVFPLSAAVDEIRESGAEALLVSSGAGNPAEMDKQVELVRSLIGHMPIFGIGLGANIVALALGCSVSKMKHGHYGASYPVRYLKTGRIFTTAQNHGFIIDKLAEDVEITFSNINDGTAEGIQHKTLPVYGVQFIPKTVRHEGGSGFIYDVMLTTIELFKEGCE